MKACSDANFGPRVQSSPNTAHPPNMDSVELDDRPKKRRRFFVDDPSSPIVQSIQHHSPPPPDSSGPSINGASSPIRLPKDDPEDLPEQNGNGTDGFDVEMFQAVVGPLSPSVLEKIIARSGNDVQQGQ